MNNWSNWHHAPAHRYSEQGSYIVTAATLNKEHFLHSREALNFLTDLLHIQAAKFEWEIHAFTVFSNHYHFVAYTKAPENLPKLIRAVHSISSIEMNKTSGTPGRKVWYRYWDTLLTNPVSYYTRFRYVQENAVRHRLVQRADTYPWSSAGSYLLRAPLVDQEKLATFPIDRLHVEDDYVPIMPSER